MDKRENRSRLGGRSPKIFIAGEAAGGNITAAVAMLARDRRHPKLRGQILISPMLNPWLATSSMRNANAGMEGCQWAEGWRRYLTCPGDAYHPYASPGTALRLAELPKALLLTAIDDPMRDDTFAYAQRLREAGMPVEGTILPGPTGWPCALTGQRNINAPWIEETRHRFQNFFEATGGADLAFPSHMSFSL